MVRASAKELANVSDGALFHWICVSCEGLWHLEKYLEMYVGSSAHYTDDLLWKLICI